MIIIIYFKYKKFEIINNLFNLIFIKLNKMNFVKTKLIKSSKYGDPILIFLTKILTLF